MLNTVGKGKLSKLKPSFATGDVRSDASEQKITQM